MNPKTTDLAVLIASLPGLRPESPGRHVAPEIGFDPSRDPGCIRAGWIADHPDRHLPDRIRSHRYVQVCEVAR